MELRDKREFLHWLEGSNGEAFRQICAEKLNTRVSQLCDSNESGDLNRGEIKNLKWFISLPQRIREELEREKTS